MLKKFKYIEEEDTHIHNISCNLTMAENMSATMSSIRRENIFKFPPRVSAGQRLLWDMDWCWNEIEPNIWSQNSGDVCTFKEGEAVED